MLLPLLFVSGISCAQSCCEANACTTDKTGNATAATQQAARVAKSTEGFSAMAQMTLDPAFRAAHREEAPFVLADPLGSMTSYANSDGTTSQAYYVAAKGRSDKALIIVHDWRGLSDEAKQQADAYAEKLGRKVHVLAIDLYDGKVGTTREENGALMRKLNENRAHGQAIVTGARDWINTTVGSKARVGTLGWCMGGSWSFTASVALGEQAAACVIYYGEPSTNADVLSMFAAPVLMHVPENDKWITPKMGEDFKAAMAAAKREAEVVVYPGADHAFANPTSGRYVSAAAEKADAASVAFLKKHLLKN